MKWLRTAFVRTWDATAILLNKCSELESVEHSNITYYGAKNCLLSLARGNRNCVG